MWLKIGSTLSLAPHLSQEFHVLESLKSTRAMWQLEPMSSRWPYPACRFCPRIYDSTEIKSHALQNLFKIMLGKPRMKNTKGSARSVTRREAEARAVRSVNRHEAKAGGL